MEEKKPLMVSIICLIFNHEKYIRQCLDGILIQKTNYSYEVIIHDDASTDGSATIIREYAEKFPEIIIPIIETENLYSRQDGSFEKVVFNACRGKYIAFCEGDDYWINPSKLQLQTEYLEKNDSVFIVGGKTYKLENTHLKNYYHYSSKYDFSISDYIENITFIHTSTFFFKNSMDGYLKMFPESKRMMHGDISFVLFVFFKLGGTAHIIDDYFSVYRIHSESITHTSDHLNRNKNVDSYIYLLKRFNEQTNYLYDKVICNRVNRMNYSLALSKLSVQNIIFIITHIDIAVKAVFKRLFNR